MIGKIEMIVEIVLSKGIKKASKVIITTDLHVTQILFKKELNKHFI